MFLSFEIDSARISLVFGLNCNPKPDIFWPNFNQCLINDKFRYPSAFRRYPLRMILLNPVPYCYMVSFDKIRQLLRGSS
jgi:hypothetical protein